MAHALRIFTRLRLPKDGFAFRRRFLSVGDARCGTVIPYRLTDIGEGIRDVTVKEWFVKPGDRVSQFQEICEVQSDKASVTITSRYDGLITTLRYKVNDVALVGEPLVDIEVEKNPEEQEEGTLRAGRIAPDQALPTTEDPKKAEGSSKPVATPAVRRLAAENRIDLGNVTGTGRDGRVLKEDILRYLEGVARVAPTKRYTKQMWSSMTRSLSIPHFVYSDECDVTKIMRLRTEAKDVMEGLDVPLSLTCFFLKAASKALQQMPQLNGWIDEDTQTVRLVDQQNIGVAIDTPEGLVVPNIKNVQKLSIVEIARELMRLRDLGRRAALSLQDLTDGTFTISNIGVAGGTYTKPVIMSPQIAIGAIGKVQRLPRFDEQDNVIAANIVTVSWAADHRVLDGVTMANYSNLWKSYVENPMHLVLG